MKKIIKLIKNKRKKKDKKIFSAEDNAKLKEISFEFPLANSINPFDHISLVLFSDNFPILLSLAYSVRLFFYFNL